MQLQADMLFEAVSRFKRLHLIELLVMMPHSETAAMKAILYYSQQSETEGCSVTDIAKRIHVSVPMVSKTVKRLREKGLIDYVSNQNDRRNVLLVVNSKGKEALKENAAIISSFISRTIARMESGEAEQLFCLFNKFYDCTEQELEQTSQKMKPNSK